MKKVSLFMLLVCFSLITVPVSAHTLKVSGTFGVTMHIDPDDEPIVNGKSNIFLDIHDTSHAFDPASPGNCDCTLQISQNGQIVKTLSVISGNSYLPLQYVFPQPGKFLLTASGKPNGNGPPFKPFTVQFDYYVKGKATNNLNMPPSVNVLQQEFPYIASLLGSVIVLLFILPVKKTIRV